MAAAMCNRWQQQITRYMGERQQGFLKKKSIIRNLWKVEEAMALGTLSEDKTALLTLFCVKFEEVSAWESSRRHRAQMNRVIRNS